MSRTRFLLLLLCLAALPALARPTLPPLLETWRDWVLAGEPWRACVPQLDADPADQGARICAWPGLLRIDADAEGARFSQRWQLQSRGLVPLPGDAMQRPVDVLRDGRPVEVLLVDGRPVLQLDAGEHRITGRFAWQRRPEALPLPEATALVALRLDGRDVLPVERRDGRLWLGRGPAQVERESLSLRVFRRLSDGVPQRLDTLVQIDAGGRAREQLLGIALPPGFVPVSLEGPLPATIDADGQLRVQLRPGSWRLALAARAASADAAQLGPRAQPAPWPDDEVWSFRPLVELRVVQPEGARPVDPQQVGVPWGESLPSFALAADERLQLVEVSRGRDPGLPHRLRLQRALWLDFDGGGFTARDRLHGELANAGRLDLAAPWRLLRANQDGVDLLVTAGGAQRSGVELRRRALALDATARHEGRAIEAATGWVQDFESAALTLHLPPGWRLLSAGGADSAPGAWIERWRLLDLFWLSVLCLLAHRLGGGWLAVPVGSVLLLGWHEPGLPIGWLSVALALGLLRGIAGSGRFAGLLRWARRASLAGLVVFTLPFVGTQLQTALYPQLERDAVRGAHDIDSRYDARGSDAAMDAHVALQEVAPPPPPPAPAAMAKRADTPDRVTISGTRLPAADDAPATPSPRDMQRYPQDAIVQAGVGLPDWAWQVERIGWDGPVSATQPLDLWLSPPWLTTLWRLALCALLAATLFLLLRGRGSKASWPGLGQAAAGALLMAIAPLQAAEVPPPELLDELHARLTRPPPCGTSCAALARVELQVVDGGLQLALDWHAAAPTAVPLPQASGRWQPQRLQVNGQEAESAERGGRRWLRLERGVQHVLMAGPLTGVDAVDLQFLHPPAAVQVQATGWEVAGLDEGRLQGDSLQLLRVIAGAGQGSGSAAGAGEFPPFVRVSRRLNLDLDWTVMTEVRRIAPMQGGFTLALPLLDGEQPLSDDIRVRDGQAQLVFGAGVDVLRWQSRLPIGSTLRLQAGPLARYAERWQVAVGPLWSVTLSGLPELNRADGDGVRSFQPLPGETLELQVQRPQALHGAGVAIDRASADWHLGQRSQEVTLVFDARATRGGNHTVRLPADAQLLEVSLRGQTQNLRLHDGALALPLLPGENAVRLRFRLDRAPGELVRAEGIDLGADSANLTLRVHPGEGRWLLWAGSDGVGPVLLYWPQLLVMAIAAWLLARYAPTPLRWSHWLLLGLGFSTVSWWAAAIVAAWLVALGWRAAHPPAATWRWRFIGVQLALGLFTVVALLCLLAAIPYGLLGSPDMQVTGQGSSAARLATFLDRSTGALPTLSLLSLPLWLYKGAILLWSLWLANALLGWLCWGIEACRRGGGWPARRVAETAGEGSAG